ncbi:MAG: hypothetical protein HKO59_14770, partial [Phycisphaerales bacterium]|nr:hypothetical protein [Phycisphaerales bacterium]
MTHPLARDITWLTTRLDEVETDTARAAVDRIRTIATGMLERGDLDPALATLDPVDIHAALKLLTTRFHLRNKAEQIHIARVNREREREATPTRPRPESLAEAVGTLARDDVPLATL